MKNQLIQMRFLIFPLWIFVVFAPTAIAYTQDQLKECISSAMSNPSKTGESEESIKAFCECSLEKFVDQGKDLEKSAKKCAKANFFK